MRAAVLYCKTCRVPVARLPLTAPAICPKCHVRIDNPHEPASPIAAKPVPPLVPESETMKPFEAANGSTSERSSPPSPRSGTRRAAASRRHRSAGPVVRRAYARAASRSFEPATGLIDIFDWQFKKYLTPYIVRAVWIFCLFVAALWLGMIGLSTGLLIAPDLPRTESRFERPTFDSPRSDRAQSAFEKAFSYEVLPRIFAVVMGVTSAVGVLLTVLFIRVILESMIVLFNIAASLTAIETQVGQRRVRLSEAAASP
jgi:hypothetical protein